MLVALAMAGGATHADPGVFNRYLFLGVVDVADVAPTVVGSRIGRFAFGLVIQQQRFIVKKQRLAIEQERFLIRRLIGCSMLNAGGLCSGVCLCISLRLPG